MLSTVVVWYDGMGGEHSALVIEGVNVHGQVCKTILTEGEDE